ncbi:unnamed protein product [Schistocephalus solidus]|uniref:Zinc finger protein n=1 Tax=Schistocephalus solidus TaxID=70667 RepID=A0A183T5Y1_SCHSO|nr:unnamed protein product [Schistocephalus solidus]
MEVSYQLYLLMLGLLQCVFTPFPFSSGTLPRPSALNERTRHGLSELALTPQKAGAQTTMNLNPEEYAAIKKEILSRRRLPCVDLSKDRLLIDAYLKRDSKATMKESSSSPPKALSSSPPTALSSSPPKTLSSSSPKEPNSLPPKEPVLPTSQKEVAEPKPKPREPPKAGAISCFVCCMAFMANELEAHVKQKHKRLFNFQCPKCPRAFFYYPKLIKHLVLSHHCDDIPPREECRIDNSSIRPARREQGTTTAIYQQHVRDGESRCLACRAVVATEHMKKHVDEHHTSFPRTRCYLCGARFDTAAGVEEHVRRVHFGASGSLFGLRADFRASKTTLQEEVERQRLLLVCSFAEIVCYGCLVGFSQSMSLMEYQYELADTWNHQSNAEDAETNELKGPKKAINVDFFGPSVIGMCPICKKILHGKKSLKTHIEAIHHPTLPFKCNECGRRYAIKQVLNDHMYRFHTEQPSPTQPATEVAQAYPTSQSEIYIIGNQIYFAENLVSVAAVDGTSDGTVDPSALYETIQIDGQPNTITFEQPADGVHGSFGPLIALDVNNSDTILQTDDLERQTILAGVKPQTMLTTAAQVEGAETTHTLQPALVQGPDGVSMQQVYLAYQPY